MMRAMLSFNLECGTITLGSNARFALRTVLTMFAIGSLIKSPTGFDHARDHPVEGSVAEGQTRGGEFAQVTTPAAGTGAAVDDAAGAGVARQRREAGVILLRLQLGALGGEFLHRLALLLVAFEPGFLGHKSISPRRACPSASTAHGLLH